MYKASLRKVGGSIMLALPPALLDIMNLRPGDTVNVGLEMGRVVIEPRPRPRYTLEELLADCNPKARQTKEDREWLEGRPAGSELL
ncbi:MAG TPA: antitoxin [Blastocatellia bacterium]